MTLFNTKTFLAAATLGLLSGAIEGPGRTEGYMKLDPIKGELIEKKATTKKVDGIKGKAQPAKENAKRAKHVKVCKTGEIIKMIKGKVPAEKIAASCYK